jgi:hypothetical protein
MPYETGDPQMIRVITWLANTAPECDVKSVNERFRSKYNNSSQQGKATLVWFVIEACRSGQIPFIR